MGRFGALLLFYGAAHSYVVHEDEWANKPEDKKPTLPYSVDSNRISDGIASVSPFTSTSPSFPLYTSTSNYDKFGVTTELELQKRKDHYQLLAYNQRLQGLAGPRAGEAEREAAAYARLVDIGDSDFENPSTTFVVDSSKRWNPSAFPIQAYEVIICEHTCHH